MVEEVPDYEYVENEVNLQDDNAEGKKIQNPGTSVYTTGFKDMLLKPQLQRAIADCGFEHPSEVQQECIPQAMIGVDILCQAKSEDPKPCSALVLCHNRELAYQIKKEFQRFQAQMPDIRTEVIFGGVPLNEHITLLKGVKKPHIVVGTPGRVLQLVRRGDLDLSNLQIFVLDECDKMLEEVDMRGDVQAIFKTTPPKKQVMMFSATMSNDVKNICRKFMRNQFEIFIDNQAKLTLHGLKQYYLKIEEEAKIKKLIDLLDSLQFNQVIVFVKSVERAQMLDTILRKDNFPSIAIHRNLEQDERIKRYTDFKGFKHRIMVSTDIFGRGIDIEKINVVFNFDMPQDPDSYLHRVGRAGRFGTKGLAISFVSSPDDLTTLDSIQKRFEVKIEELPTTIDVSSYMNN